MYRMYSWIACLSFVEMTILSVVVIFGIVGTYYLLCSTLENKRKAEIEGEKYNPEWMDYDKWKRTRMEDIF